MAKKSKIYALGSGSISRGDEYIRPADQNDYNRHSIEDWKRFGSDNLFPQALAYLNRKSPVHRGIINSRTRYVTGAGFNTDDANLELFNWKDSVNAYGESLRAVFKKLVFDKISGGNCYLEIVTNRKRQFFNIYHHDYTSCRVGHKKMAGYILKHPDWSRVTLTRDKIKRIPLYPNFEDTEGDGNLRSIIHFKDYEPEFEHYGVIDWIAGMGVSAIAYKTDKWNISRLDNSFNSSGTMIVDAEFANDEEAKELKDDFLKQYTGEGKAGKMIFIAKSLGGNGKTEWIPFNQNNDADWTQLHQQSGSDLVIAHGWFRSLCGFSDNTGFDTQRILNEYQIALNTVIPELQGAILDPLKEALQDVVGMRADDLMVINKPPVIDKPGYMTVWEARKADGLDYDPEDPAQQVMLANLGKSSLTISTGNE